MLFSYSQRLVYLIYFFVFIFILFSQFLLLNTLESNPCVVVSFFFFLLICENNKGGLNEAGFFSSFFVHLICTLIYPIWPPYVFPICMLIFLAMLNEANFPNPWFYSFSIFVFILFFLFLSFWFAVFEGNLNDIFWVKLRTVEKKSSQVY